MADIHPGLVSTIIPVFNRPAMLEEAVASVLAQTYRPVEILIVDDGSTDDTPLVAQRLAAEHPELVRYLHQRHAGAPYAGCARGRNTGIAAATGEFVQLLDSDDVLMPQKFARQVAALRGHPACGLSYGYVREYAMGDPPRDQPARRTGTTFAALFPDLLYRRIWPSPSPLYRRAVMDAAGPFNEVVNSDWEFECRVAALGVVPHHCRTIVADVRNTQALEGRRVPGRRRPALPRNVDAHEMMLASAIRAGVGADALSHFGRRMFDLARACAAGGFETDARRCLATARTISAPARRWKIDGYVALSRAVGWQRTGAIACQAAAIRMAITRWLAAGYSRWRHRARRAGDTLSRTPLAEWPVTLRSLWAARGGRPGLSR